MMSVLHKNLSLHCICLCNMLKYNGAIIHNSGGFSMNFQIGEKVFGDWEIISELGQGGYGKVFELQKNEYGIITKSALKVMRIPKSESDVQTVLSEGMDEESVTQMFQEVVDDLVKEIAIMTTLKGHPNIVRYEDHKVLRDSNKIGWDILIRMELLTPLNQYATMKNISEADVVKLGKDIGNAISFCEKKGLIHRDIKPENIFVDEFDNFKLGDFGIARTVEKTTGGLSRKGTELYMAPEVYIGKTYDSTVDIYSLGLVLYKLLNGGRLPFYPLDKKTLSFNDREQAVSRRIKGDTIESPRFASNDMSDIILKACSYNPPDRYKDAVSMITDLKKINNISKTYNSYEAPEENDYTQNQSFNLKDDEEQKIHFSHTVPIGVFNSKIDEPSEKIHFENKNIEQNTSTINTVYEDANTNSIGTSGWDWETKRSYFDNEEDASEKTEGIGGKFQKHNSEIDETSEIYSVENIHYTDDPIVEINRTQRKTDKFSSSAEVYKRTKIQKNVKYSENEKDKTSFYAVLSIIGAIISQFLRYGVRYFQSVLLIKLFVTLTYIPVCIAICFFDLWTLFSVWPRNRIFAIINGIAIIAGNILLWISSTIILIHHTMTLIVAIVSVVVFILTLASFRSFKWLLEKCNQK